MNMARALSGLVLLIAVSSCYSQASIYPPEAEQLALDRLLSMGVVSPGSAGYQYIAAPVSAYLFDILGYRDGVLTAFRVGVTDEGDENPGEVFMCFSYGADGEWSPASDAPPEELLVYEFLMDDREEFMALAHGSHPGDAVAPPAGTIYTLNGRVTGIAMLAALSSAEAVFVGEQHDDPLAHEWELYIWKALASPERALALEMFETDVQPLLDGYLSGGVTRGEFLAGSRPWGNYETDYEPLVEYARENSLRVIAANVPRPLAAAVAMRGFMALEGEGFFQAMTVDSSNASYRARFLETISELGDSMHGMPMDPENLYRAQLLKDAVMASSIAGQPCVIICGRFHSDFHSGIPDQLPPGADYLTVTILGEGETVDFGTADFIIVR